MVLVQPNRYLFFGCRFKNKKLNDSIESMKEWMIDRFVENMSSSSPRWQLSSSSPFFQVNAADHLGQTALHRAARCGHLQTCRLLLSAGADPLLPSQQGLSPSQLGNESVQEILQGELEDRGQWKPAVGFYCLLNVCVSFSRGSSDRQLWGGPPASGSLQNRRSGNRDGKSTLWGDLWFSFKMMMSTK